MKGTWKILKQHVLILLFMKIIQLLIKKLMPEIFNDRFVNISEKLANKFNENNIDPLRNVPETEKGSLLKQLTQTSYIDPYQNLKMENHLE